MQAKIFCKTVEKGTHEYYVVVDGETYYLFRQPYRASNKEFFGNGVSVDRINNYSGVHSSSVRKTMDKLPSYIRFVEKEYGIAIYDKTRKAQQAKYCKQSARKDRIYRYDEWDVA